MTIDDIPPAPAPLAIHPALATALTARGYETMTAVQLAMLEPANDGADLLVSAQTGSGKTVAFGIAIADTLLAGESRFGAPDLPLGLVIAPTRELALQVQRELAWLYADAGVVIASCVGGMDARTERRALERGAHIVVGTPGRLRDHITRNALDLSGLRAVVLDEADEMLDLGFREDLEFILGAAPEERRTLMFSATVPAAIARLAKTFQRDAVRVTATAASEPHADIEYQMMLVHPSERENAIINTLLYFDSSNSIVFCHTREAVKHLTARLANRGFAVVALSGELAQSERTSALEAMRNGRARVCVATDVAARGIDLPNLDLVIHADVPTNPDTLLHRSGRTGRAGRKGVCILVVPTHRRSAAQRVLGFAQLTATIRTAPTVADIDQRYRQQIIDTAVSTVEPDEVEQVFIDELLARLSPAQIAVAYLRQQLAARPAPEDISDTPIPSFADKPPRRDKRFETEDGPRQPRQPDMVGGVWFSLSLGRKHRADPKWLLPMICKAGGVTKRDVGSIKIEDTDTRFEIAADKAEGFAAAVAGGVAGEKAVTITPLGGAPKSKPYRAPRPSHDEAPRPPRDEAPRYKVRTEKGEKLPAEGASERPAKAAFNVKPAKKEKPAKEWVNPKDKGKPKYKKSGGAAPFAGEASRKRPPAAGKPAGKPKHS
jgi:ATP-dependent RNA helicase DeaD